MKTRLKRAMRIGWWSLLVTALLAGGILFWQKKVEAEERALEELAFDEFEMKAATFEDALQQVTAKVRQLGHPEVQLVIYPDASKAPGFHALLSDEPPPSSKGIPSLGPDEPPSSNEGIPGLDPKGDLQLSIKRVWVAGTVHWEMDGGSGPNPITLKDLLAHVRWHFHWACAIRGRQIVATPARGTLERYRKETIRVHLLHEWRGRSPMELQRELQEKQGVSFYEGMTVAFRQGRGDVDKLEIYGPKSEIEVIDTIVSPHPPPLLREYYWRLQSLSTQLWFRFFP